MDFKRHLQVSHKLSEEQYREEFCGGGEFIMRVVKQDVCQDTLEGGGVTSPPAPSPGKSPGGAGGVKRKRVKKDREVEGIEALSTDLQCYFRCDEVFKKDYQLHLHLKLRHRDEDAAELERAYEPLGLPLHLRPLSARIQRQRRFLRAHTEQAR